MRLSGLQTPSPCDQYLSSGELTDIVSTYFHDRNDDDKCPICAEADPFDQPDNRVVKTPCGHIFHRMCLSSWLETLGDRGGTCPSCRELLYIVYQGNGGAFTIADRHDFLGLMEAMNQRIYALIEQKRPRLSRLDRESPGYAEQREEILRPLRHLARELRRMLAFLERNRTVGNGEVESEAGSEEPQ